MSFLNSMGPAMANIGASMGAAAPAAAAPNWAATGLGKLLGVDPGKISTIAGDIGKAANPIAAAGGAGQGYEAPPELPAYQPPRNHMQLLDPKILQALIQQFGGGNR